MTKWRLALVAMAVVLAVPGEAAAADGVELTATIDGRDIADAGAGDPIDLDPSETIEVNVEVVNGTDEDLTVRDVEIEGVVIGITFLSYDTDVSIEIPAGETEELTYELPLRGLADQAVGLLPASMSINDEDGSSLARTAFTVDVAGSSSAVFALFGYFLGAVTAGTVLLNLWLVLRRRLPPNRIARALRFAISGIGLGLTLTVALAVARILPPYASAWIPLLAVPTGVAIVLGLLSPGPLAHAWPEDEIDVAIRETVRSGTPS